MNYSLFYEKYHPFLFAVILTFAFYKLMPAEDILMRTSKFFDYALRASISLAGFFLAVTTLLHSVESRRVRFVKSSGNFGRIERYLSNTILAHFVVVIMIMGSFFISAIGLTPYYLKIVLTLQFFIVSFTMLISLRFVSKFLQIMRDPMND
ncbi:MAG: hypothetical protein ACPGVB_07455 [Chitinophagales bacterium]